MRMKTLAAVCGLSLWAGTATAAMPNTTPSEPGESAFATIAEIVTLLEADPATDWATVNISALREHLVDMNVLMMNTTVRQTNIDGGAAFVVKGEGRALQAIHAMVPAHAGTINGYLGWQAAAETLSSGAVMRVTATTEAEISHIRALGFYGVMASDSHHQAHHLGLAKGQNVHNH